eukprot:TRINITY_DN55405_c0_g1_i1.p1 TRINITY_DN55405_c0_g1~~TRINITY_DN55405_c0_g1_i1.p1  ORF type:complete len:260 (+),score=55.81 TRINITY_DN55405_c0_g1_i1:85-780(+)
MTVDPSVVAPTHPAAAVVGECLSAMVVGWGVASAWRGAWVALDAQLWPEEPLWSAVIGLLAGFGLLVILVGAQGPLAACVGAWRSQPAGSSGPSESEPYADAPPPRLLLAGVVDVFYSYACFWCALLVWRGSWQLWDHWLDVGLPPGPPDGYLARGGWLSHGVGMAVLLLLGRSRSTSAPPAITMGDTPSLLLGGRASPALGTLLWNCCRPEALPSKAEWHERVGLPEAQC